MKRLVLAFCSVFLAAGLVSQEAPQAGSWEATVKGSEAFKKFEFWVSPKGTAIMEMTFGYSNFRCGPVTDSVGRRTITYTAGVPIAARKCEDETQTKTKSRWPEPPCLDRLEKGFSTDDPSPGRMGIRFDGEFEKSGTRADGTWQAVFDGEVCAEGTWEARPVKAKDRDSSGGPEDEQ